MVDEKDTLVRLISGEHTAFKEVYDFYIHKVHRFVATYIKDKEQVKDIVQLTFIKIWEKKETIDVSKSFKSFVFTIAYHNVIDFIRRKENILIDHSGDLLLYEELLVSTESAETILNRHNLESVYTKALETLAPQKREIFIMSRHEGLSNKEIAEKKGISVKTVEYHMTGILSQLKEYFIQTRISNVIILFFFF